MKIKNLLLALLALPLLFVACEPNNPVDEVKDPTVTVTAGATTESTIAFTVASTDAEKVAYLVVEGAEAPTASEVLANGVAVEANKSVAVTATELKAETDYTIVAAAQNSKGVVKSTATAKTLAAGETPDPEPDPEPTPDPDVETFVATHYAADFDDSEGFYMYGITLGDKEFGSTGWGVNGGTYYNIYFIASKKNNGKLPLGTYSLSFEYNTNTVVGDYSSCYYMNNGELENYYAFKEANLVISENKIEFSAVLDNGKETVVKVVYEGALTVDDGTGSSAVEAIELIATDWVWGGPTNYGNKYQAVGEGFSVDVHFQTDKATQTSIVAGEYIWTSTSWWGYNDFEDFTTRTFVVDGTSVAVDGGIAVVENEGDYYFIEITLEGRDGETYVIYYEGELTGEDVGGNEPTTLNATSLSEGTYNSAYYFYTFKAAGEGFSFDLLVNEYQAKNNQILADSYTYAPGKSYAGNNNFFFVDSFKVDGISYKATETSTMVVEGDGSNVVITLNLAMQSGDQFVVTYNGVVGGSADEGGDDVVEATKLATPTVAALVAGNAATISWNEIDGAKDYTVTLDGTKVNTVNTAHITYQDLGWETEHTVTVVANPADAALNLASDAGTTTFTTEANPNPGEGGDDEPSTGGQSFEGWQFSATLDQGAKLITVTDGSHTVEFTINQISSGIFYIFDSGVLNITKIVVNGVETTNASGTVMMSTNNSYHITLDATINGVRYTGTSSNSVV